MENPDPEKDHFLRAYDWMRQQMKERIPGYQGNWPWWAWHTWATKNGTPIHKPDLRNYRWCHRGANVRMELNVPDEKVLLSCFDGWHAPLNRRYLAFDDQEEEAFYGEFKSLRQYTLAELRQGIKPEPRSEEQQAAYELWERRKEESWTRCFDLEWMRQSRYQGAEMIQACFEELRLEYVQDFTLFHGKF